MTYEEGFEADLAQCKTLAEWLRIVCGSEETTGHEREFELITTEHEAFELAWHIQDLVEDKYPTRALAKCLELIKLGDGNDSTLESFNELYCRFSYPHLQFLYHYMSKDAVCLRQIIGLVHRVAELNGLDLT